MGLSQAKESPWRGGSAEKACLWSLSRYRGYRMKWYRQSRYSGTLRAKEMPEFLTKIKAGEITLNDYICSRMGGYDDFLP